MFIRQRRFLISMEQIVLEDSLISSSFLDLVNSLNQFGNFLFSPLTSILEKRKITQAADAFVQLLIDETKKKQIDKFIFKELLDNMPKGIWNVETIEIVESNVKKVFDKTFVDVIKNDPNFEINDPRKRNYFVKRILLNTLGMQAMGLTSFRKQLLQASVAERSMPNIKIGRELIETLSLMETKSKSILKVITTTRDIDSHTFREKFRKFWISFTLLFLRILDIIRDYSNKKDISKKLKYLSIERAIASSYC